jgi:hypothetical protein
MLFTGVERMPVCEIAHQGAESKCCLNRQAFTSIGRLLGASPVDAEAAIPHWLVASLTTA